jgi:hypothetical protein
MCKGGHAIYLKDGGKEGFQKSRIQERELTSNKAAI